MSNTNQKETQKSYKRGDTINLMINGREFFAEIVDISNLDFYKKYCLKFEDGSKKWVRENIFSFMKN